MMGEKGYCTCWLPYPNICHKRWVAKTQKEVWKCMDYECIGKTTRGKTKCVKKGGNE